MLSTATLAAVGAVLLCLLLLLLLMAIWHRRDSCCSDFFGGSRASAMHDGLLDGQLGGGGGGMDRETVDSSISCAVCMETQINSILMPCAHEVACMRCAQRLGTCPVCRAPVSTTLRTLPAAGGMPSPNRELDHVEEEGEEEAEGAPKPAPAAAKPPHSCLKCAAARSNTQASPSFPPAAKPPPPTPLPPAPSPHQVRGAVRELRLPPVPAQGLVCRLRGHAPPRVPRLRLRHLAVAAHLPQAPLNARAPRAAGARGEAPGGKRRSRAAGRIGYPMLAL